MKTGIRILAVACAPLKKKDTLLVGIIAKDSVIEGVVSSKVQVNGTDATKKIIALVNKTRFKDQVRLVAVNGIGLAGLNVLDVDELRKRTKAELISVTRGKPHPSELITALRSFSKRSGEKVGERIELVNLARNLSEFRLKGFYLQTTLEKADAGKFVERSFHFLRLAHLIASGVTSGESKGRI
ncbi:MAG: DUF99 family protein [Candidatus Micrarchaeales archaeon]|nr:DUF99 family protein [Candidatus Micrarchaeales archaeon]